MNKNGFETNRLMNEHADRHFGGRFYLQENDCNLPGCN